MVFFVGVIVFPTPSVLQKGIVYGAKLKSSNLKRGLKEATQESKLVLWALMHTCDFEFS